MRGRGVAVRGCLIECAFGGLHVLLSQLHHCRLLAATSVRTLVTCCIVCVVQHEAHCGGLGVICVLQE